MLKYVIKGPTEGGNNSITVEGSKNCCIPLLASTILFEDSVTLTNVNLCNDVLLTCKLLQDLGSKVEISEKNKSIKVTNRKKHKLIINYNYTSRMRGLVTFLGALLSRYPKSSIQVGKPGGCSLGYRGIGFHLEGFKKLNANHSLKGGYVKISAKNGLLGNTYRFPKPSVTGSANLILSAVFAKNTTTLKNISIEPEVVSLIDFLNNSAKFKFIKFKGKRTIQIKGIKKLIKGSHRVIGDRINAFSYLCVGAITRGKVKVNNINPKHLPKELEVLKKMGCEIKNDNFSISINAQKKLKPVNIITGPWPLLATDNMPILMAVLTTIDGKSTIKETIFSNRYMAAPELVRMGASINIKNNKATIIGVKNLFGAQCISSDLRTTFAIILGAIAAKGSSTIFRVYHGLRGYYQLSNKLKKLGVNIKVIS